MTQQEAVFIGPPVTYKQDDTPRRVGFELEFTGLTLDQTETALVSSLKGVVESISVAERKLHVEDLGTFNIELDWEFLKRTAARSEQAEEGGDWVDLLSQAATLLVPMEVVCPPIPIADLGALLPMVDALRQAGAIGTEHSPIAAYGVHVNTEIPSLDAGTLNAYLRAFALLQWWLVDDLQVDVTRKISPYIDLFPQAYLEQLFSRSEPTLDQVFSDYLQHNATRNRALDMLPILSDIDNDRVRRAVDDPKIKSRPAFHYRLPDCHVEKADWTLVDPWNNWLVVERLANQRSALDELSSAFLAAERPVIGVGRSSWVEFIDQGLRDHELV